MISEDSPEGSRRVRMQRWYALALHAPLALFALVSALGGHFVPLVLFVSFYVFLFAARALAPASFLAPSSPTGNVIASLLALALVVVCVFVWWLQRGA